MVSNNCQVESPDNIIQSSFTNIFGPTKVGQGRQAFAISMERHPVLAEQRHKI